MKALGYTIEGIVFGVRLLGTVGGFLLVAYYVPVFAATVPLGLGVAFGVISFINTKMAKEDKINDAMTRGNKDVQD